MRVVRKQCNTCHYGSLVVKEENGRMLRALPCLAP